MAYQEGGKVLAVEDDEDTLSDYQLWLENLGLLGSAVSSAGLATKEIKLHDLGLIVMDGLDGDWVTVVEAALSCMPPFPKDKLVLRSGDSDTLFVGRERGIIVANKFGMQFEQLVKAVTTG